MSDPRYLQLVGEVRRQIRTSRWRDSTWSLGRVAATLSPVYALTIDGKTVSINFSGGPADMPCKVKDAIAARNSL